MNKGDYVRTKSGIIGKIKSKNYIGYNDWIIDTLYYNNDEIINDWTCGIKEYDIIKSSPNIIDLIEVGDYVNGKEVLNCKEKWIQLYDKRTINDDEIKSILTKEQFEEMEYRI